MLHHEPVVTLPHVGPSEAIVAWGAFAFHVEPDGTVRRLADLDGTEQIGLRPRSGGTMEVRVWEADHPERAQRIAAPMEQQWVRLEGLRPNTAHRYEVLLDGRSFTASQRQWIPADRPGAWGRLVPDPQLDDTPALFRTLPAPGVPAAFSFAAFGDPGVGVDVPDSYAPLAGHPKGSAQRMVADRLDAWLDRDPDLRFALVTGDVVYARRTDGRWRRRVKGVSRLAEIIAKVDTGDEDDDWYFKYFLPYRRILRRIPLYVSAGNHDGAEFELQVDRAQLVDNLFIRAAFPDQVPAYPEDEDNDGLSYQFLCGDVRFVAIDTSMARFDHTLDGRLQIHPIGKGVRGSFERRATRLAELVEQPARTVVTFGHHPPQSTGPVHDRSYEHVRAMFVPERVRRSVSVAFWGHEHNLQVFEDPEGPMHVMTGAGGKVTGPWNPLVRADGPEHFLWGASVPHFVVGRFDETSPDPTLVAVPAGPATLPAHPASVEAWQVGEDGTVPIGPRRKILI